MLLIPKIIHYCWFGRNPLPELAVKCFESWKKHCPDYKIIEWNEANFDINYNDYVKEAYEAKKWAFVSDVARLYALVYRGGIYMDTDVEVLKPLDSLLELEAFSGFESDNKIPTGLMACKKGHPLFEKMLKDYDGNHFINSDGSYDLTTNVVRLTNLLKRYGLVLNNKKQSVAGFALFPKDYFCAKDWATGNVFTTENTFTIHHFAGSWLSKEEKETLRLQKLLARILPISIALHIVKFIIVLKNKGLYRALQGTMNWIKNKMSRG